MCTSAMSNGVARAARRRRVHRETRQMAMYGWVYTQDGYTSRSWSRRKVKKSAQIPGAFWKSWRKVRKAVQNLESGPESEKRRPESGTESEDQNQKVVQNQRALAA